MLYFVKRKIELPSDILGPGTTDQYWNNVVLLMTGDDLSDVKGHTVNPLGSGTNVYVDTIRKAGSGSLRFSAGKGLSVPTSSDFQWQDQAFTVECWVRFNDNSGDYQDRPIINTYTNSSTGFMLSRYNGTFKVWLSGDGIDIAGTTNPAKDTWYHVAVSGSPGSYKLFVNGIQEGATYTKTTSLNATANLSIGQFITTRKLDGWIDDLRITKGVARYTANFTVPTTAHPITGL